jgi:hypothetical protein
MKTKEQMKPGKRYRGYGFINEYKEFCFEPEDTGAHAGREKSICVCEGIRVSETKNFILVKFNLEKREKKLEYLAELAKIYNHLTRIIQKYEI